MKFWEPVSTCCQVKDTTPQLLSSLISQPCTAGVQLEPGGGGRGHRQDPITHPHQTRPAGNPQRVPHGDRREGGKG